ncbi:CheR family methyltransferase [Muricoccus pecuniae]|uniref:Chemotaxis protein methyltransferase n=1 Tax=Muricoccus pecuniae TaxID=693023 RepID=A0A840Y3C8_9PROT|nr:protein-glutamate O-methyltransferase [Roseomonas pecuniae]MBB5695628.1 chemotaxis protein methyltransferase CheR [Roseomonas pecuniae]
MLQDRSVGDVPLTEADFDAISKRVREASGIVLGSSKRDLVYGRLRRRLRVLGITSFAKYLSMLDAPEGAAERVEMVNAITTNLTGFFRERHHFEYLERDLLPHLPRQGRRLRIWSAGCSSGEEPYTIAMTLHRSMPDLHAWDARILATDIDTEMVSKGAAGVYPADRIAPVPAELQRAHVHQLDGSTVRMGDDLKALIAFRQLNLLDSWPMRGPFDAIFCRNVVIYFDKPTQRALFDRFADMLVPGGHLFIGHSESLFRTCDRFRHLGRTIYQKLR